MPRHGSAAPGADVESVHDAPRGSSIAGWSIRRKLGLLVTIPLIVLLVGGGALVASLGVEYQRTRTASTYANAIAPTLSTTAALDAEFGNPGEVTDKAAVAKLRAATDAQIKTLRPHLEDLKQGDPNESNLPIAADTALTALARLGEVRAVVDRDLPTLSNADPANLTANSLAAGAIARIANNTKAMRASLQDMIFGLTGELSVVSPDRDADRSATFVSNTSLIMQNAVAERALVNGVLKKQTLMDNGRFADLTGLGASQSLAANTAKTVANPEQSLQLTSFINLDSAITQFRDGMQEALNNRNYKPTGLAEFNNVAVDRLNAVNQISKLAAEDTQSLTNNAKRDALLRVAAVAAAVLITLAVVTTLLAAIARTVTTPLRRLRAGAVEIASVQLPAAVARIEQDGVGADVSLPPVLPANAFAGPETLEVARAVDDLGAEAVRLATAQVRLRRALDEAFVSMSRRSQSMVEKQLAIIDELESQEQDPDQLRNLFRLDHLAARMRRYNDNLLVLAGSAVRTRATAPVKIAELFRAATSEMEQYERVRLQPVSGASIAGTVAGELVHLLAELLDNAAMYSPPSSAIVLSAAFTADGGLQIEVLDAGVGISPGELDRLNGRLTQPESIDTQVPSRMGLFVVARLARRGTFGVMLQSRNDASGTVALVRVPNTLVIGAPGSTGEQPVIAPNVMQRPSAPAAPAQFSGYPQPAALSGQRQQALPPGALAPAAAAAGEAAQAAAGVRSVAEGNNDQPGSAALPRRRRTAGNGPNAGLPAEAMQAAASPAAGLFTPATPPEAGADDTGEWQRNTGAMNLGRPAPPPATSPTGIGGMQNRGQGLPTRGQQPPVTQQPWDAPPFSAQPVYQREQQQPPADPRPQTQQPAAEQQQPREGGSFFDTPAAGITGLPGLAPPVRRGPGSPQLPNRPAERSDPDTGQFRQPESGQFRQPDTGQFRQPESGQFRQPDTGQFRQPDTGQFRQPQQDQPQAYRDPLNTPTGSFRQAPNQGVPTGPIGQGQGGNSNGWEDDNLPTEIAARAAAAAGYRPSDPNLPMIGDDFSPDFNDPTPIFDQISVWFTSESTESAPEPSTTDGEQVIDLRGEDERRPSNRWASLGDQRWLATNARAAAAPDTEGTLETGLPKRRPGANLLPSAATAAANPVPPARPAPVRPAAVDRSHGEQSGEQNAQEAAVVRGRLGSYQRGLANARRARTQSSPAPAFDPVGASLFTVNSEAGDNAGRPSGEQGGDQ